MKALLRPWRSATRGRRRPRAETACCAAEPAGWLGGPGGWGGSSTAARKHVKRPSAGGARPHRPAAGDLLLGGRAPGLGDRGSLAPSSRPTRVRQRGLRTLPAADTPTARRRRREAGEIHRERDADRGRRRGRETAAIPGSGHNRVCRVVRDEGSCVPRGLAADHRLLEHPRRQQVRGGLAGRVRVIEDRKRGLRKAGWAHRQQDPVRTLGRRGRRNAHRGRPRSRRAPRLSSGSQRRP